MAGQKRVGKLLRELHHSGKKGIAWLVDPDKFGDACNFELKHSWVGSSSLDLILIGGSELNQDNFSEVVACLKRIAGTIPVVIFPGSGIQLSADADGILFTSLISGRNPEYLIGQQILAAPVVNQMNLEILPTGYLLVNDGEVNSVHYISQTIPLPNSKPQLAVATALAGKFMGMKFFFLDAGSGAKATVAGEVIAAVKSAVRLPVIVGGGINSLEKLKSTFQSGADIAVIGNAIERNPSFLEEVLDYKNLVNHSLYVYQ